MEYKLQKAIETIGIDFDLNDAKTNTFSRIRPVKNPTIGYSSRNRSEFRKPDYNFSNIDTAQDSDSFLNKAIEKKTLKFLLSGFEFSGENPQAVEYIKKRIKQIEVASNKPFPILLQQTAQDLFRYYNCIWVLSRNKDNSGGKEYTRFDKQFQPISGIFIPSFDSLEFKTKDNGDIERIRQSVPGATRKPEWTPDNFVYFYVNKRPGYTVASPGTFSALEDIVLLRRLEEQVQELIEGNLFPLFHYKIGTELFPEKVNPKTGMREAEEMAEVLEYMPSSGLYISDWRHSIEAIGSEGKALDIANYLEYFKKRVFAAIGVSPIDMGESDSSNRSTAQTQSKSLTESVEAIQLIMKTFIDNYLIVPLLLESSFRFDVLAAENLVEINFNKIDSSEQVQNETNANQLYQSNALTHEELRKRVGLRPLRSDQENSLNYHRFPDRAAIAKVEAIKAGGAGSTQAANQYGKSAKKTASKKDCLLENDLLDYFNDFKMLCLNKDVDELKSLKSNISIEFIERYFSLFTNRCYINDIDLEFDDKKTIFDLITVSINNLIDLLIKKVEMSKTYNVKLDIILDSSIWYIEEYTQLLDSIESLDDKSVFNIINMLKNIEGLNGI